MEEEKKRQPHKIEQGAIRANVFTNETATGGRWYAVELCRDFKDKQGEKKVSHNFAKYHLYDLVKAIVEADLWIERQACAPQVEDLVAEPVVKTMEQSPSKKRRAA
jgi:hypothetical protein